MAETTLAVIRARACEPRLRLADIAAEVGASTSMVSHCLKRDTGMSFPQHLNRIRIERSVEFLRKTSWPIVTVAMRVGYERLKDFERCFHKLTGLSPSAWRRKARVTD